jgi:hypothetical protein
MGTVALRIFIYSILPLIIAVVHLSLDKSSRSRERKLEIFLLYLFGVGVAGSGIGGFFGHFFISDSVRNPSAGRPGIPSSSRSALPIWQSVFLVLSPWAGAMASVRPPSLP